MTGRSCWVDLDGPVHYVDHGGPAAAPLLVLVHGLGGSHANWSAVAPLLTPGHRVLALDLAGFGLTAGGPRSARVDGNRRLLGRFLAAVAREPVVLVGNSMGGLICALQASIDPAAVRALVLIDPALPFTPAVPDRLVASTFVGLGAPRRLQRWIGRGRPTTTRDATMRLLRLCTGDPDRIAADVIDEHVALARRRRAVPDAEADLLLAARSLGRIMARPRRYAAMLRGLGMPVMLIHGDADRLIPIRAARRAAAANPHWRFETATGIGHVPMLEAPRWTAAVLADWLPAALDSRDVSDAGRRPSGAGPRPGR